MVNGSVIETQGLTKRFAGVEAVRGLDLTVAGQQITGFLGRNGAGKSTTIKMLLGMAHPTSGTGTVLGKRITDTRESREMRRHVAYVGEDKNLYAYLTVEEMIRFTRSFYSDWRSDVEQRLLKLYDLPTRRKVKALSKGMRTKLALLLAFARQPALVILDEPSEGLDPVSIEELLQSLVVAAGEGTTVFFSSHQIAEVERVADRVCMIDRGRLVLDIAMDQLRQDYRGITMGFARQPEREDFQDFLIDGIDRIEINGRQVSVLASHNVDGVVSRARNLQAVSIDVAPVNLREIFLAKVKEGR
jgi:ABC-2 type transport system ATP-binding protein